MTTRRLDFRGALRNATALLVFAVLPARADVRMPHVFGEHMVLQRDMALPIWGWADAGEEVTVELAGERATTTANAAGEWSVRLAALPAGGPHTLTVLGRNRLELGDVLIGEVWLCAGQSNMEMGINSVEGGREAVAAANFPQIRLMMVPSKAAIGPQSDVDAVWQVCSPETLGSGGWLNVGFSAVAYFFGLEIHKALGVPVGLIDSSWGGTRIEPWTPPAGFAAVPALAEMEKSIAAATPEFERAVVDAVKAYEAWLPEARAAVNAGKAVPAPPAWPKHGLESNTAPTALYNGMIHPLTPYALRGAIWYQGESNYQDGMLYFEKMKALIAGWRSRWGQGDFPFYYVQIAPFGQLYSGEQLPRLWEAQSAALSIPNTGMVVTVDISDVADIHPKKKREVGERLARWALAKTYGKADLEYSGPRYASFTVEGAKIRIRFTETGGGLASRDGAALNWFTVAGADRQFVAATAEIDGDSLLVGSDAVAQPVAVRFAWDQRAEPNLMNRAALPASPFRTDDW